MKARVRDAALVAVALLASSCAGGGPDDEIDRSAPADEVPALMGVERNLTDGARRVDTTIEPGELEPPLPPLPTIGELTIPCGPAADPPSAEGAPGVTAESITIGTGNDRGGLYTSGSGRGIPDTIRILADRCNSLGGINGRLIEVVEHDAAVVEVEDQTARACESDFALVGQGYLLDTLAEGVRVECGLPSFPAWTSMRPSEDSRVVVAVPTQADHVILDGLAVVVFAAGEAGARVGVVVPATPGGRDSAARLQTAVARSGMGIEPVVLEYPVDRAANWDAIVSWAAAAEIGAFWVEGSCESSLVPLMTALEAQGMTPPVTGGPGLYDPYCAAANASALDGVLVALNVHPAEDRAAIDAVDAHVQLLRAAGVDPTADALRAASAFWLWASATSGCSEPLTRECVVVAAGLVDGWTAGGLHPATDPGAWTDSGCFALLAVVDGGFERISDHDPGELDCEPEFRVEVG